MQFENSYQISTDIQRLLEIRNPLVVQATLDQIRKRVAPLSEEEREELFWQARRIVRFHVARQLVEIDHHPVTQALYREAIVLLNSGIPSYVPRHNTTPIWDVSKRLGPWVDQLQNVHSPEEVRRIVQAALLAAGSYPEEEQQFVGRILICSRLISRLLDRYLDLFERGVLGSDLYLPSLLSTFETGFFCPMAFLTHLVYQPKLHAFTSTMGTSHLDEESQPPQPDTSSDDEEPSSVLASLTQSPNAFTASKITVHIRISDQPTIDEN